MMAENALVPTGMDEAIRLANAMSKGKLVPEHLQGSPGDCLMVVEQSMRWGMSPFAVAQCTSSIHGRLMFEGKLVAAAIENSGAITTHLDYEFSGEGDQRQVTVIAIRRGETAPRKVEVKLADVRTDNRAWKTQPDQQLVYAGTRIWARRWVPAVMLGVYTPEEFTRTGLRVVDAQESIERHERALPPPKERSMIDVLRERAEACETMHDVEALAACDDAARLLETEATRVEAARILADARARMRDGDASAPEGNSTEF